MPPASIGITRVISAIFTIIETFFDYFSTSQWLLTIGDANEEKCNHERSSDLCTWLSCDALTWSFDMVANKQRHTKNVEYFSNQWVASLFLLVAILIGSINRRPPALVSVHLYVYATCASVRLAGSDQHKATDETKTHTTEIERDWVRLSERVNNAVVVVGRGILNKQIMKYNLIIYLITSGQQRRIIFS